MSMSMFVFVFVSMFVFMSGFNNFERLDEMSESLHHEGLQVQRGALVRMCNFRITSTCVLGPR